jgi:hypothetical protein
VALILALVSGAPAGAVIIASGDGTGNTSAPPDDPGWDNVVSLAKPGFFADKSGVYLGNGWVLTANHVVNAILHDVIIGSEVFEAVPGSKVRVGTADVALFQIVRDPGLLNVVLIRTSPPVTSPPPKVSEVVTIGNGRERGQATSCGSRQGWLWHAHHTIRWGTNKVHQTGIDSGGTRLFSTRFDAGLPTNHEAQATVGDSGGAVFIKNETTSEWELAGIISSTGLCQWGSAIYNDLTYAADLSFYWGQIDAIASVPACNDGLDQDGDGLIDYPDDPGCDDLLDPFETSDALPCDDGIDNDGDGGIDFDSLGGGDPGCKNPTWSTESPECQDGIHNDADGMMDYDAGLSANGSADPAGPDPQCVGKPWRDREAPYSSGSYPCGLGAELALLLPALMWTRRRRR